MIAVLGVAGSRNKLVTVGSMNRKSSEMETLLVELGRGFYARGWRDD